MSALKILEDIKAKNEVYVLTYEDKPYGLRVKTIEKWDSPIQYYDFTLETIAKHSEAKAFIQEIQKGLTVLPLIKKNGMLATAEEHNGGVLVKNFENVEEAWAILSRVKLVYDAKK